MSPNVLILSEAWTRMIIDALSESLELAAKLTPRMIRVRRRGFSSGIRCGDTVKHDGKLWNVARRSNWHLWLYEHVEMEKGATIKVKLPTRYQVSPNDQIGARI